MRISILSAEVVNFNVEVRCEASSNVAETRSPCKTRSTEVASVRCPSSTRNLRLFIESLAALLVVHCEGPACKLEYIGVRFHEWPASFCVPRQRVRWKFGIEGFDLSRRLECSAFCVNIAMEVIVELYFVLIQCTRRN